ncbi:glycosyltransferase family 2 protein [Rhodococcus sp. R1101]|uniref:glycosyltransferase family 2 protein n=1 Tax=Rhodococcus sp. R1101 TaxID=1170698 RepID=UPI000474F75C|nr:glycosyltransferase family 2 protein [Rhodococcus sp. R1101]
MATNRLSIVVPAHNEERYIGQCLAALLAQRSEIHEILVVDNNSTDRTAQIVDAVAAGDPLVRRIVEERPGVAFARNAGFDAATGDLIGRIDADTRVRPEWARTVRTFFAREDTAAVGAISGLNNSYDSPYRALKKWYVGKRVAQGTFGGERRIDNLHGANMALRRSAWEQVRDVVSTDPRIHEDLDLALCLRKADIEIAQLTDLYVDLSPRRAYTPPREYAAYIRSGIDTFELHGRLTPEILQLIRLQSRLHVLVYAAYRPYDPDLGRFTLRRAIFGSGGRAMPIDVKRREASM